MNVNFEKLVEAELDRMFAAAYNVMGNVADAEDAVQEAVLKFIRNSGRYDPSRPAGPYLAKITVNVCLDRLKAPDRKTLELNRDFSNETVSSDQNSYDAELEEWLSRLSPGDRLVIDFFYREEMSLKEIARMLDEKENTVKVRLFRARQKLRELASAGAQST